MRTKLLQQHRHHGPYPEFRRDLFKVLDGVYGRDVDIRPIDECACYNEDGSFNASQFEAFLDRESDESPARMRVLFLFLELLTESRAKAALNLRAEAEPPHKKHESDKSRHSLTHLLELLFL